MLINAALRRCELVALAHTRSTDRAALTPYMGMLRLLLNGLHKLPVADRVVVYRGAMRRAEELGIPPVGQKVWCTACFMSICLPAAAGLVGLLVRAAVCGHLFRYLWRFSRWNSFLVRFDVFRNLIFPHRITAHRGVNVKEFASNSEEDEIILLPGTVLEVSILDSLFLHF